jgi:hypothetical protein
LGGDQPFGTPHIGTTAQQLPRNADGNGIRRYGNWSGTSEQVSQIVRRHSK